MEVVMNHFFMSTSKGYYFSTEKGTDCIVGVCD